MPRRRMHQMLDWAWIGSLGAGAICFGAGMLAWGKAPSSLPAGIFLTAMMTTFVAMITGPLYVILDQSNAEIGVTIAKVFVISTLLTLTLLWNLCLVFPIARETRFWLPNRLGLAMIGAVCATIILGSTATLDYSDPDIVRLASSTSSMILVISGILIISITAISIYSMTKAHQDGKRSARIFLIGVWLFVISGVVWTISVEGVGPFAHGYSDIAALSFTVGVAVSGLLFGVAIARGQMVMEATPATERLVSSSKAKFNLLHRYVYLVEEPKPDYSFAMFSDILKGRCFDCENDESFPCESLECSTCGLPCPCKQCKRYGSRPQGMIVTRQFPKDVRSKYFIQTTPILWLSTVAGKDNMDPSKLSLLTDYLVNFMEKSHNAVVLIDGIEYLATSSDFPRTLRAIDRWTETAMASNTRLILSVDPKSFDAKELAILERNREVVKPDAAEKWMIIPEPV